jgi:hypothetical protein
LSVGQRANLPPIDILFQQARSPKPFPRNLFKYQKPKRAEGGGLQRLDLGGAHVVREG